MVAKNVFTQTREALGFKSPAGPRANCARSRRASRPGRNSLVFPASCSNVSAPSARRTGRSRAPPAGSKLFHGHLSQAQLPVHSPPTKKVGLFVSSRCPSRDRQLFQSANPPTSRGDELGGGAATAFKQRTRAFQITPASNLLIHL